MHWLIVSLRLSETEQMLQYPKMALVTFCAVFAARACFVVGRHRKARGAYVLGGIWSFFAALLLLIGFRAWEWEYYGGAALIGAVLAFVPASSTFLARIILPVQLLGVIAVVGTMSLAMVGALP